MMRAHYNRLLKREGYSENDNIFLKKYNKDCGEKESKLTDLGKDREANKNQDLTVDIEIEGIDEIDSNSNSKGGNDKLSKKFREDKDKDNTRNVHKKKNGAKIKKRFDPLAKANLSFAVSKAEKNQIIEEKQKEKKRLNNIALFKKKKRNEVSKLLGKKTSKGQPLMKAKIQALLGKLEGRY